MQRREIDRPVEVRQGEVIKTMEQVIQEAFAPFAQWLRDLMPELEKLANQLDPSRNAVESDNVRLIDAAPNATGGSE